MIISFSLDLIKSYLHRCEATSCAEQYQLNWVRECDAWKNRRPDCRPTLAAQRRRDNSRLGQLRVQGRGRERNSSSEAIQRSFQQCLHALRRRRDHQFLRQTEARSSQVCACNPTRGGSRPKHQKHVQDVHLVSAQRRESQAATHTLALSRNARLSGLAIEGNFNATYFAPWLRVCIGGEFDSCSRALQKLEHRHCLRPDALAWQVREDSRVRQAIYFRLGLAFLIRWVALHVRSCFIQWIRRSLLRFRCRHLRRYWLLHVFAQ